MKYSELMRVTVDVEFVTMQAGWMHRKVRQQIAFPVYFAAAYVGEVRKIVFQAMNVVVAADQDLATLQPSE